ncbi:AraC family transcriptional regulator [Amycolatopsis japonica]|uniref:AraC family transcriptional regulator n=1 Tax=Amycolatopsis japonica TaxID=208439 RepID=UPI00382BC5B5
MENEKRMSVRHGFVVESFSPGDGPSETVDAVPGSRMAGHVLGYRGYRTDRGGSALMRVIPATRVLLDISLEAPPRVLGAGPVPPVALYGMRTAPTRLSRSDGLGIVVELPPHVAYSVFGAVNDTVLDGADLLGGRAGNLVEGLAAAPGWRERMALLDDTLAAWTAAGPVASPRVVWAWRRLCRTGGRLPIGRLADEIGWTRRNLLTRFRAQIGVSPKAAGRVIRFDRALRLLRREPPLPLSAVAQIAGYSDQPHLTREFRSLAGGTPAELAGRRSHSFKTVLDSSG